jgi:hypothetical protein
MHPLGLITKRISNFYFQKRRRFAIEWGGFVIRMPGGVGGMVPPGVPQFQSMF